VTSLAAGLTYSRADENVFDRIVLVVPDERDSGAQAITPAHLAVEKEDLPRPRQLLDEGADIGTLACGGVVAGMGTSGA
jgi:hypothetical protein